MKYNININQKAIIDNKLNIDLIDAAIFDVLKDFSHSDVCKKSTINGDVYFLFNWKLVTMQLPLSNLNTRQSIYKRFNKLCDAGLIERCDDNQVLNQMLFKFGKNYDKLIFQSSKENKQPVNNGLQDTPKPVNDSLHQPVNNGLHNNSINTNNNIKKNNKDVVLPFDSIEFRTAWDEWKEYKAVEHRFKFKSTISEKKALTALFELSGGSPMVAINIIDNAISQGWQGLYLPKTNGQQPTNKNTSSQLFHYKTNGEVRKHSNQKIWEKDKYTFSQVDCYEEIEIRK